MTAETFVMPSMNNLMQIDELECTILNDDREIISENTTIDPAYFVNTFVYAVPADTQDKTKIEVVEGKSPGAVYFAGGKLVTASGETRDAIWNRGPWDVFSQAQTNQRLLWGNARRRQNELRASEPARVESALNALAYLRMSGGATEIRMESPHLVQHTSKTMSDLWLKHQLKNGLSRGMNADPQLVNEVNASFTKEVKMAVEKGNDNQTFVTAVIPDHEGKPTRKTVGVLESNLCGFLNEGETLRVTGIRRRRNGSSGFWTYIGITLENEEK